MRFLTVAFRTFTGPAFILASLLFGCQGATRHQSMSHPGPTEARKKGVSDAPARSAVYVKVRHPVKIRDYFKYMDSVVNAAHSTIRYPLTEHVIVHANPWLLDSLKASDYYVRKEKGSVLLDQPAYIILHRGDSLLVPDSVRALAIRTQLASTLLDLNIPEYRLRLIQRGDTILDCRVRVGRNAIQYLALAGRKVNLRTPIGRGKIVRIARVPYVLNPETGKLYQGTHRDDGVLTEMPVIPWLEPEINGVRYGDLIHPTTNPATLGKAISHGCVGTTESDAWTIYYNCPVGTRVNFRYDLKIRDQKGDTIQLKDIYRPKQKVLEWGSKVDPKTPSGNTGGRQRRLSSIPV
jgi:hypothetical protein